jgi:hypothetical protein
LHADLIINQGWTDKSGLEEIGSAIRAWGEHPDAFLLGLDVRQWVGREKINGNRYISIALPLPV